MYVKIQILSVTVLVKARLVPDFYDLGSHKIEGLIYEHLTKTVLVWIRNGNNFKNTCCKIVSQMKSDIMSNRNCT